MFFDGFGVHRRQTSPRLRSVGAVKPSLPPGAGEDDAYSSAVSSVMAVFGDPVTAVTAGSEI
jgi:hypothetical protein